MALAASTYGCPGSREIQGRYRGDAGETYREDVRLSGIELEVEGRPACAGRLAHQDVLEIAVSHLVRGRDRGRGRGRGWSRGRDLEIAVSFLVTHGGKSADPNPTPNPTTNPYPNPNPKPIPNPYLVTHGGKRAAVAHWSTLAQGVLAHSLALEDRTYWGWG